MAEGARATLQVTDEKGNEVRVDSVQYSDTPDTDECLCDFWLTIPATAESLNLTFAVHRSRFFAKLSDHTALSAILQRQ